MADLQRVNARGTTEAISHHGGWQDLAHLVRPHLETNQRIGTEGVSDGHVSRIPPLCDQHAAYSRHVIARVEGVPPPAQISLEPAGEIHRAIGRRNPNVSKITGAYRAGMFMQRQKVMARCA